MRSRPLNILPSFSSLNVTLELQILNVRVSDREKERLFRNYI